MMGWQAGISFDEGVRQTYEWFLEHANDARGIAK